MSVPPRSQQHGQRVVDIALEGLQQLGAKRTVDRAMVDQQRAGHDRGRHDLTLAHDGPLLAHADSEDAALRRIDHLLELLDADHRSEEHTYELQSLMSISYAVFRLLKKKTYNKIHTKYQHLQR